MNSQLKQQQNWVVTWSLATLGLVAIGFVLHYTQSVLIPFVVSIFIGAIVSPLMDIMELRWKIRHSISVLIALTVVVLVTVLFAFVMITSIRTIVDQSQRYYAYQFEDLARGAAERFSGWFPDNKAGPTDTTEGETLEAAQAGGSGDQQDAGSDDEDNVAGATDVPSQTNGADSSSSNEDPGIGDDPKATPTEVKQANPRRGTPRSAQTGPDALEQLSKQITGLLTRLANSLLEKFVPLLNGGLLTVFFVTFVLAGRDPNVVRQGVYAEIDSGVRSYIATKVALSLATGVLVWLILWFIGMEMAGVFGLLAFLLNFIPSIGSIIATAIPIPFALARYPDFFAPGAEHDLNQWVFLGAVVALPGTVQLVIGNILEPKLMGRDLQLHPIAILLALAIWGLLWGAVGMLLAVPMTAIIRIVLMKFEITRPFGNVLAGELPNIESTDAPVA